jgi:hypothetical protein
MENAGKERGKEMGKRPAGGEKRQGNAKHTKIEGTNPKIWWKKRT